MRRDWFLAGGYPARESDCNSIEEWIMKRLLIVALALVIAGGAVAEDTFGLWRMVDGEYVNYIPGEEVTSPFTLYVTIHQPTSFSIGGYEVGITAPADMLVISIGGPNGWTNFGAAFNHLVGFQTPVIVQEDIGVLCEMSCLGLSIPDQAIPILYGPADPPSIPGHDGPVYADGINPELLVPCGFVTGTPDVFLYGGVVATEAQTLSDVKALFD
jgi:hypothetical protein